eukprot:scaffold34_cov124-Isochrysis_galbana.AAC.23
MSRLQYEDLPREIRKLIMLQLRKIKAAAATVFQKYNRGRLPRLAYQTARVKESKSKFYMLHVHVPEFARLHFH